MTKEEARELIDYIGTRIGQVAAAISIVIVAYVFGAPMVEAHYQHGRPVYDAAEKGDSDAVDIIRAAAKGNPLAKWILGE